ncbi:hypothetical protein INT45_008440 [Circinella minor]|uniref:Uncharacterized protein n=1 Tax=Circinella minor TaxID=1195481 RepID=A0A8H7VLL5_9FUNG|nr:hypothetical protein INT45_008440 [Circinella minor]
MSSNSEVVVTDSQAACIFYGEEITPENELLNEAKIDAMHELELCYINDTPSEPFLVSAGRPLLDCESQLKEFVDNVFLSVGPCNEKVYERSELSSQQVFQITCQYTTLYKNNKLGTFTNFAKKVKAQYLKAEISRKRSKEGRVERKILYVMKPHYRGLKMDGFDVIGYARKSPTEISDDELKEIIKNMISCLQSRSQVTDVYVSPSSRSKSPIAASDMTTDKDYTDISGCCVGNTQSLLTYLSSTTKQVWLVIVDYAALSTDPHDILLLVNTDADTTSQRNSKSLECIIVDRFQDVGKYEVYRRNDILKTPEQLTSFDCRPKLPHRSI